MEIISREGILQPPKADLTPMPFPDGWVAHYVGSQHLRPTSTEPLYRPLRSDSTALWQQIQKEAFQNVKEHYIDIQYNFGVDAAGRIFEGRGWLYKNAANRTSNYNGHAWAVCYLGAVDTILTAEGMDALRWLTWKGGQRGAAVSYVKGHNDVYATKCPGFYVKAAISTLNDLLHVEPIPKPPEYPEHKFDEANVKAKTVTIQTDSSGNGWTDYDPGYGRAPIIVGISPNGPYPPTDGYWSDIPVARAQVHGNVVVASVAGGKPSWSYVVHVAVA